MEKEQHPEVITLLFTDIEGSSRLWEEQPLRMQRALASHDMILRRAVEGHRGMVVKMTGDGLHAAFADPGDAMAAAVEIQLEVGRSASAWELPLRVRCGTHAGVVERRERDFFGSPVNRAARIMSAAHGGQILASKTVVDLATDRLPAGVSLRDLGRIRLRDLESPEHVYQLVHPALRADFPALRSLEVTPNNLPRQVSSFIGRELELAQIRKLLRTTRILTLVGPGGIGKTRLSLQVAADALDDFGDGVWFVDLTTVVDPRLVTHAVAHELGVQEDPAKPSLDALCANLRSRRLLLVLDNCEHLLDSCAQLVNGLARSLPDVSFLCTGREALGIMGEQTYLLGPLSLPDPNAGLATLAHSDAARLFIERARQHHPDFTINATQASAMARICIQLDGIPLALELAAARVGALSVELIADRLVDRFHLLNTGSRVAAPRQQTLRATIDWSFDLLESPEKTLLLRLSVFAGGWDLEAAEAVAAGGEIVIAKVLDLLARLVQKSLVDMHDAGPRYVMLETIRQYAQERLHRSGEEEVIRGRHLDYYLALAQQAESVLRVKRGHEGSLRWLAAECDNIKAALRWSLQGHGTDESALRLCAALTYFWRAHGRWHEGRELCAAALAYATEKAPSAARAEVLLAGGLMALRLGARADAQARSEQALALAQELGNRKLQVEALNSLANIALDEEDFDRARELLERAVAISRELGDRTWEPVYCVNTGYLFINQGNFAAASPPLQQALTLSRELGNRWLEASALGNLGVLAMRTGDLAKAEQFAKQALAIFRELGAPARVVGQTQLLAEVAILEGWFDFARGYIREALAVSMQEEDWSNILECLHLVVRLAIRMEEYRDAANFCGVIDALRGACGARPSLSLEKQFSRHCGQCRSALGDEAYGAAFLAGRELPTNATFEHALTWLTRSAIPSVSERPIWASGLTPDSQR